MDVEGKELGVHVARLDEEGEPLLFLSIGAALMDEISDMEQSVCEVDGYVRFRDMIRYTIENCIDDEKERRDQFAAFRKMRDILDEVLS